MEKLLLQEWGIVGVLITLFAGQIMFLQKTLMKKLHETDEKVIALLKEGLTEKGRESERI